MKYWYVLLPGAVLSGAATLYKVADAGGADAQSEYIAQCRAVFDQRGETSQASQAVCDCTMVKGQQWKATHGDVPTKEEFAGMLTECGQSAGVDLDDPTNPWN
jgi:hypothetical protein